MRRLQHREDQDQKRPVPSLEAARLLRAVRTIRPTPLRDPFARALTPVQRAQPPPSLKRAAAMRQRQECRTLFRVEDRRDGASPRASSSKSALPRGSRDNPAWLPGVRSRRALHSCPAPRVGDQPKSDDRGCPHIRSQSWARAARLYVDHASIAPHCACAFAARS